jgi:hypothetical protein
LALSARRIVLALALVSMAAPVTAQNWSGDARKIAMGGANTGGNLASTSVEDVYDYHTVVIPLGLFQVLRNIDIFNPDSDEFDLLKSIEYAAAPLHWTHERDGNPNAARFVNDMRNGVLSRDLNTYRGFVPVTQPISYGIGNPNWGARIPVYKKDRVRHGVYVGAGPYVTVRADAVIDDRLADIFASETPVAIPGNVTFVNTADVRTELALAIIGGYRGRFPLPMGAGSGDDREGIYVAVNYNYLHGFFLEDADMQLRMDTNSAGLLTFNPALPVPASVLRSSSDEGHGRAIDLGVSTVVNKWEFGFGINGLANEIEWKDVEQKDYTLANLFTGGEFDEGTESLVGDRVVKQPVEYIGNVVYRTGPWTLLGEYSKRTSDDPRDENRLNDTTFRTGAEYRFAVFEPRAGVYFTREQWKPSAGVGINLGKFGIDGAVYWNDTNIERKRHAAFAFSLRFGAKPPVP